MVRLSKLERLISRVIKSHARTITDKEIDLQHQLQIQATKESIEFINNNMSDIMIFENRDGIRDFTLSNITIDGLFLEFGVFEGDSINVIAKKMKNKTIHGFDSFEGLPQDWGGTFYDKEYFRFLLTQNLVLKDFSKSFCKIEIGNNSSGTMIPEPDQICYEEVEWPREKRWYDDLLNDWRSD